MREYMIQFMPYSSGQWSTFETRKFGSFREACHYVGILQEKFDERQGVEVGIFRAKPLSKVVTP